MNNEELNKLAEEYASDEMMSGLAERAFKAGWLACKEQMMKEAVEGVVVCDEMTNHYKDIVMFIPNNLNEGDKVKLIIIKED